MFLKDIVIPDDVEKFIINKTKVCDFNKLFDIDFIPNIYIFGPQGSGKYTIFLKNLAKITNENKIKINLKTINISNQWANIKEVFIPSSDYHFEINLSKYSNNRNNLFSILDAITESKEINNKLNFKLILIRNINEASIEFVKFIKQKAETLSEYVRFILIGKTNSNNLKILNGVFFTMKVSSPSLEEIKNTLIGLKQNKQFKYSKRDFNKINLDNLIKENDYNLNYILNKLEILLLNNNFYKSRVDSTVEKIYKLLIEKKISNLYEIREVLYEYQINNESLDLLFKKILNYFTISNSILDESKKLKLIEIIAKANHNLQLSYKEIIHVEELFFSIFSLIHKS